MNKQMKIILTFVVIMILAVSVTAEETFNIIPGSEYELVDHSGLTTVKMPGSNIIPETGVPELPFLSYKYLIDDIRQVIGIKVINIGTNQVIGSYKIKPAPEFDLTIQSEGVLVPGDYDRQSIEVYPAKSIVFSGIGYYRGHQIGQ